MKICEECNNRISIKQYFRRGKNNNLLVCEECGTRYEMIGKYSVIEGTIGVALTVTLTILLNINMVYLGLAVILLAVLTGFYHMIFPIFSKYRKTLASSTPSRNRRRISYFISAAVFLGLAWFFYPKTIDETMEGSAFGPAVHQMGDTNVSIEFDGKITTNPLTLNERYEGKLIIEDYDYDFDPYEAEAKIIQNNEGTKELIYTFEENGTAKKEAIAIVYKNFWNTKFIFIPIDEDRDIRYGAPANSPSEANEILHDILF
ncbi:hypothetical protein CEY16_12860 [Halalkalibacillus sediminis]|uniref:Uncharacterized protein n=1 Tax=Halalkalibacillus sediminis TaxID=2018042 RepID=A0A2I0QQV5_9BACI|nr:hypothetical protein [Halalkalibacillus sediminis]PKR76703.1 hypothetical protein CEY16_12860 [Halalkalibacillus sediminis]